MKTMAKAWSPSFVTKRWCGVKRLSEQGEEGGPSHPIAQPSEEPDRARNVALILVASADEAINHHPIAMEKLPKK